MVEGRHRKEITNIWKGLQGKQDGEKETLRDGRRKEMKIDRDGRKKAWQKQLINLANLDRD